MVTQIPSKAGSLKLILNRTPYKQDILLAGEIKTELSIGYISINQH